MVGQPPLRPHPHPAPRLPHPTDTLASLPAGRTMVLGPLERTRRRPTPPHHDTDPDPGGGWKPDKMPYKAATLRLRADLPKPYSSLLTQIRTGKIGLAAFLHQRRVPGVDSPACPCGWRWETAKHIILNCPRFTQQRWQLRQQVPSTDFQQLTSNPRAAAVVTKWFLSLDLLSQFSWASEQLLSPPLPPLSSSSPA